MRFLSTSQADVKGDCLRFITFLLNAVERLFSDGLPYTSVLCDIATFNFTAWIVIRLGIFPSGYNFTAWVVVQLGIFPNGYPMDYPQKIWTGYCSHMDVHCTLSNGCEIDVQLIYMSIRTWYWYKTSIYWIFPIYGCRIQYGLGELFTWNVISKYCEIE